MLRALGAEIVRTPTSAAFDTPGTICMYDHKIIVCTHEKINLVATLKFC